MSTYDPDPYLAEHLELDSMRHDQNPGSMEAMQSRSNDPALCNDTKVLHQPKLRFEAAPRILKETLT